MRRILLLGGNGQVGWELARTLATLGEVTVSAREAASAAAADLADAGAVSGLLDRVRPQLIVNAAAYTAVDQAEAEPDAALVLNRDLPARLGQWAAANGAGVIHYSTDYVFDGSKPAPYTEDDPTAPVNAYGAGKLAGETALLESGAFAVILRIAWVYGLRGRNFLLTMQRLMRERGELAVVADQIGAPTWCRMVAQATAHIAAACVPGERDEYRGVYHLGPAGTASWYDFACAINEAGGFGCHVRPITSEEYPTPARRPANSRLDSTRVAATFGVALPHWRESLALALA